MWFTWLYVISYPWLWIKYLSAKTTKYILKCWERSVKRKTSISFRVIKNSSFDQGFLMCYMAKTFLKIFWWRFLVPRSEHHLVNSASYRVRHKIFWTLSMLVYYNTNSFFLRSFSLMNWLLVCSIQFINNQGFKLTYFEVSLLYVAP